MQTIKQSVSGLSFLAHLNLDRFLFLGVLAAALFAAGYINTL